MSLPFDRVVPANGYAWWYLDVLCPEANLGLTAIVFVGSVFSSHYAADRARGDADPERHFGLNIALYRPGGNRWVMSEYSAGTRDAEHVGIGASTLTWIDGVLTLDFDERTAPFGRRVAGKIRLHPECHPGVSRPLTVDGAHQWSPIAPVARAEVELTSPSLRFSGEAYHDANFGIRPLEADFSRWNWSRIRTGATTEVLYDCVLADGRERGFGTRFRTSDQSSIEAPVPVNLSNTGWRLPRPTRTRPEVELTLHRTLEDTPFYNRSWVHSTHDGAVSHGVHEHLDLERFKRGWVQFLLPFKTRRR